LSAGRIDAVLFDLGDTLLHFGALSKGRLIEQAMRRSYDYLQELNQPVGSFWAYRLLHLWGIRGHLVRSWLTGSDFNSLQLLQEYGAKRGFTLSPDQWEELNWRWYEGLANIGQAEPGTAEALAALAAAGLKLGILSNTFIHKSALERHLDKEGLLRFFPVRLYSYEYPWRKPNVKIFLEAAKSVGAAPQRIVFVGDLIKKDVAGAQAAGMIPVLKTAYSNAGRSLPSGVYRIDRIADLPALIETINRNAQEKQAQA